MPKAKKIFTEFSKVGVDMYLSGHHHVSAVTNSATRQVVENYSPIIVYAGTVSVRQRKEAESFNVIKVDSAKVTIETYMWDSTTKTFNMKSSKEFSRNKSI